jgi:4-hydroxy-tetrahydrodipicolinate synthase
MPADWTGVFPAVTTQFHKDERLNLEATARHIEVLLDAGVQGIIVLGSLGENTTLEPDEKLDVVRMAVETVAGRVPVLSGVSENSTTLAKRYVRDVEDAGADGVMVLPAMIYKSAPEETMAHFRDVAGATGLPILIYNNPIAYGVDITPQMFQQLADVPNFTAIKESSGDTRRITDILNACGDRYNIFVGLDDLALEGICLGAKGWVAGTGLAFPKENQYLWDLASAGWLEEAREIYRWYMPLLHLDTHLKFVQYLKLALQEVGLGQEWVRAPRRVLQGAEREQVLRIIREGIANRPEIPEKRSGSVVA